MALKVYCCTTGNKHKIHRTRGCTAFSVVCHVPANIQATSAFECDLWYGVRRPYVALVFRCYTDFEIVKKTLKITAPNLRALGSFRSFDVIWKNASSRLTKFSNFSIFQKNFGSLSSSEGAPAGVWKVC